MKKVKVEDMVGLPLLNDITEISDGFKGARFKRGHIVQKEDIPILLNLGKKHLFVQEENSNEIHEEDAAYRLAKLCSSPYADKSEVSEGKINIIANTDGFLEINKSLLTKINSIEDITITTAPNHFPIKKGMIIASARIIPLMCDEEKIRQAEKLANNVNEKMLINLHPYKEKRVGIVITGSEVYSGRIKDKFEEVLREKLSHFSCNILGVKISDDDEAMIKDAALYFIRKGVAIVLFTGGMSVDADDITTSAIKSLGAKIITHGVPSQPGNMTLVADLGGNHLIGVPGAAISKRVTVLDAILPSLFTDYQITKEDLISLGCGGLCLNCNPCTFPCCTFGRW